MTSRSKTNLIPLYEEDENLWLHKTSELILQKKWDEINWEYLGEYLEDKSKSEKRQVISRLRVLIMHLLKWLFQKEYRSNSWKSTIVEQRNQLNGIFTDSKNLEQHAEQNFLKAQTDARELASLETDLPIETFPEEPHLTFKQTVDKSYYPE